MLKGKTVIVTGASRGIGKAIAQAFLAQGANVVLFARNQALLSQVAEHGNGLVIAGDITRAEDRQRLIEMTVSRFGQIDILINNAGVVQFASLSDTSEQVFAHHFTTNFFSVAALTNAAVPYIPSGGSVIFISTSITSGGFPGLAAYSASKGALESYMRTAAVELASKGIIVNAVAPGPTKSDMWANALPPAVLQQIGSQLAPRLLTGDFGDPQFVANAVLLLAQTPTIRGQRLVVDAGYSIS